MITNPETFMLDKSINEERLGAGIAFLERESHSSFHDNSEEMVEYISAASDAFREKHGHPIFARVGTPAGVYRNSYRDDLWDAYFSGFANRKNCETYLSAAEIEALREGIVRANRKWELKRLKKECKPVEEALKTLRNAAEKFAKRDPEGFKAAKTVLVVLDFLGKAVESYRKGD